MQRTTARVATLAFMLLGLGCPTRRNPALDDLPDSGCGPGSQLCDDHCVADDDPDHCGGCDVACADDTGCDCEGDPPTCVDQAGHECYALCEAGEILCGDLCVHQPDPDNCGECGVRCEDDTSCQCRDPGATGAFSCLRSHSGSFTDCTR